MDEAFDFGGWATRNNIRCTDGRTIRKDAFKHLDGQTVPLTWNHSHDNPFDVLGHALLQNKNDGVYAYGVFNDTSTGKQVKEMVLNGDVTALSIWANHLDQTPSGDVLHGDIKEVSIVLAGANPGAHIETVLRHGDDDFVDEAIIQVPIELMHSDSSREGGNSMHVEGDENFEEELEHSDQDVFDSLNDEQRALVVSLIAQALESNGDDEEDEIMKHNVFDNAQQGDVISHDDMKTIITDAKRFGTVKESFLAHADDYGIKDIDWLFPEDHNLNNTPDYIKRDTGWVSKVISGVHHTPFSRIKSQFADITEDEARAKGYIKGNMKKEEVFTLLKRTTQPTTIYKKQKLDRDDIIDITDFDVVAWIKSEMRMMLDEEIARAILIGDGRISSSDDKINESNIRPIAKDDDLYNVKVSVHVPAGASDEDKAKATIKAVLKARKNYKGSGNPSFYTTEDVVTDMLLIEDTTGRRIYNSVQEVANALRVKEIVTVEVMEGATGPNNKPLIGVIVNLSDYNVGADKGGSISMFDDFDIDYNQQKYLIETRCSGALTKPFSAMTIELEQSAG